MRDTYVAYMSVWEQLLKFEDDGELLLFIKAINNYVFYDKIPEFSNSAERVVWHGIKVILDRDGEKREKVCNKRKEAANKRWGNKDANACKKDANAFVSINMHSDNDNVNDDDNNNVNNNVNKNENNFFKEKRERFCREVFSVPGYDKHHKETFVEYYGMPVEDVPGKMLFETYKVWNLKVKLAQWKAPPEPVNKLPLRYETPEERAATREKDAAAERERVRGLMEEAKRNPNGSAAKIVKAWKAETFI